jgi:hypothetical protein
MRGGSTSCGRHRRPHSRRAFVWYASIALSTSVVVSVIAFAGSPATNKSYAADATVTYASGLSTVRGTLTDPSGRQWVSDEVNGFCRLTTDSPVQIEDVATGGQTLTCLGGTNSTRRGASIPGAPALALPASGDTSSTPVALVPDLSEGSDSVYRERWNTSTHLFDPAGELTLQDGDLRPQAVSVGPDGAAYVSLGNARSVIRIENPTAAQPHLSTVATLPGPGRGIAAAATAKGSLQTRGFVATSTGLRSFSPPPFGARSTQAAWPSFAASNPSSLVFDSRTRYLVVGYADGSAQPSLGRIAIDTGRVEMPWVSNIGAVTGLGTYTDGDQEGVSSTLLRTVSTVASTKLVPRHDFNADLNNDVLARDTSGYAWLYPGNGHGSWLNRVAVSSGWSAYTLLGPGDFTGDGVNDVLARDSSGYVWLYAGNGSSGFLPRTQVATGWKGLTLLGPGDFNGDNTNDVLATDGSGNLWLYGGNGHGGFLPRTQVGAGWKGFTLIGPGDFNGDNLNDVLARDSAGDLWLYPGNGGSGWQPRVKVGAGWKSYTMIAPGDFNGDNFNDVIARDSSGYLWLYPGNGKGSWLTPVRIGTGWTGYTLVP